MAVSERSRRGGSGVFGALVQDSVLDRQPLSASFSPPTSLQTQIDTLVTHFVEETANPSTLLAITAGSLAYRLGRVGVMGLGSSQVFRPLSVVVGLGTEVSAFELTNRTLQTFAGGGTPPLQTSNANLWSFSGPGGWKESLLNDLMTFGLLKGAGYLSRESNLIFQHAFSSTAMVAGHRVASLLGVTPRPEESLAEQFLHAEVTNLQLQTGMGLVQAVSPGLSAFERGLDLSLLSREKTSHDSLSKRWDPFFRPFFATASSEFGRDSSLIFMTSKEGEEGGLPPTPVPSEKSVERTKIPDSQPSDQEELLKWMDVSERGDRIAQGNNKPSWRSHLQTNKENILKTVSFITKEGRGDADPLKRPVVRILGAGTATDVPLEELAREFRVILVDLDGKALNAALNKLPKVLRPYVSTEVRDLTGGWVFEFARQTKTVLEDSTLSPQRKIRLAVEALRQLNTRMTPPDLEGLVASDLIISTMLASQFLEFHNGIFLKHFYSPKASSQWLEAFVEAQKEFSGLALQAHVRSLFNFVRQRGGLVYLSSDVSQHQIDPGDFAEREIPVLFDPKGGVFRHLRDIDPDSSGVQIRELSPWHWDFAKLGEEKRHAPLNKLLPPKLRDLVIAQKNVEALILSPEMNPLQRMHHLREQISPTRHLSEKEARSMIPQILALTDEVPVSDKYEALVALGLHKDFADYPALLFALERLAKEEKPLSMDLILEERKKIRTLTGDEVTEKLPDGLTSNIVDSPLREAFALRFIVEDVKSKQGREVGSSTIDPSANLKQTHAIFLVTSLGVLASHPELKGEESFHRILNLIRSYPADFDSVGFALKEILKNPSLSDDTSFRLILETLPFTMKGPEQPSDWTFDLLDGVLEHPHFDAASHLETYLQTIQALTSSANFRVSHYEALGRNPRFRGQQEFRILLARILDENANPTIALKAAGHLFRNSHFEELDLALQVIDLSKADADQKVIAWYAVSENPHISPEILKLIVEKMGGSGASPEILGETLAALVREHSLYDPDLLDEILVAFFKPFEKAHDPSALLYKHRSFFGHLSYGLEKIARNPVFSEDQFKNLIASVHRLSSLDPMVRRMIENNIRNAFEKAHRYKN